MSIEIIKVVVSGLLVIFGVIIGSILTYRNSSNLYIKQKKIDNRILGFTNLMGIKFPYVQAVQLQTSCYILSEYYDTRYRLTNDIKDQDESKRKYDQGLQYISEISALNKELFNTLGLILISFDVDDVLQTTINSLYSDHQAIIVPSFPQDIASIADLENVKTEHFRVVKERMKTMYSDKMDHLINLLKERLKQNN